MARHLPGVTWSLRRYRDGQYPRLYVATESRTRICVDIYEGGPFGTGLSLSRSDARMLARRINQCLDETK